MSTPCSFNRLFFILFTLLLFDNVVPGLAQNHQTDLLLIGTYCPTDSQGIFVYRFDEQNGSVKLLDAVSGIENPSFLAISPHHRYVYAVSETHGASGGRVYAYRFDEHTGKLQFLNHQPSGGKDPCHLAVDHTGRWVIVANYSSGSIEVLPVKSDGSLGAPVQLIPHQGHGVNPQRQEGPHVHFINITPDNRYVLVSDLGLDKVFVYDFDAQTGKLRPASHPYVSVDPGTGPRHQAFSPDHRFLYLVQEMGWRITVFAFHDGELHPLQTVSTAPDGFHGENTAADIHLSPDGKFLYASNRGQLNDIVIFTVNKKNGLLQKIGRVETGGKTPRNFVISADGSWLLVGHQNSNEVTEFKRNTDNGMLIQAGVFYRPRAVCLKMIEEFGSHRMSE
ncbi:MAG: lactonase family protein [Thermoflavifilum sp.]|nr:lactonase family protein [Thermoflavifilum sp.]